MEEVGCFLKPPGYISCEWALNYHGISLQAPMVCTVVTLSTSVGKKRSIEYQGIIVEFSRIFPGLFFGLTYVDRFYIASPEKAILDTLYYRGRIPAQDELELDRIDFKRLLKMGGGYPKTVSRTISSLSGLV